MVLESSLENKLGITKESINFFCCLIFIIFFYIRSSEFGEFISNSTFYGYIVLLNLYVFYLFVSEKGTIHVKAVLLYLVCLLSLLLSNILGLITPILDTGSRLAMFILVFNVIGPIFKSSTIDAFKRTLFKFTSYSFPIVFIFNCFYVLYRGNIILEGTPGFHESPNLLGVTVSLSSIWFVFNFMQTKKVFLKIFFSLFFFLTIPVLLLSASRAAVLSLFISLFIVYAMTLKKSFKSALFVFITLVFFGTTLYSYIKPYAQILLYKVESRTNSGDITAGRNAMYEDNFKDFLSNPILGVGFHNVVNKKSSKINADGSLEYPSSWFFILSSTGLLGFIYFLQLLLKYLRNIPKLHKLPDHELYTFIIVSFFFIHMNFEGYVYSAGGLLFFLFWTSISQFQSIFK